MLATTPIEPFKRWFFEGTHTDAVGPHAKGTLASQPSIAFTAGPRRKPVDAPLGHHPVLVTIALLFVLGAVFMRG
ncbi:MAG TPA: hypothetical protein VM115_11855, partial [Vicinamibacterales bacterium]|nr:hypothetical protein [Vicinamibacterales bacterium]